MFLICNFSWIYLHYGCLSGSFDQVLWFWYINCIMGWISFCWNGVHGWTYCWRVDEQVWIAEGKDLQISLRKLIIYVKLRDYLISLLCLIGKTKSVNPFESRLSYLAVLYFLLHFACPFWAQIYPCLCYWWESLEVLVQALFFFQLALQPITTLKAKDL